MHQFEIGLPLVLLWLLELAGLAGEGPHKKLRLDES